MSIIANRFSMTKERWAQIRVKGFWNYVFRKGLIELGLGGGILVLSLKYLTDSGFSLFSMAIEIWIADYLVWMPVALLIGILMSVYVWFDFEGKLKEI